MKVNVQGNPLGTKVIRELLSPWDVTFTNSSDAQVTIFYSERKAKCLPEKKTVIIPFGGSDSGETEADENVAVLAMDIVQYCYRALDDTLNAKSSAVYRILTGLPIPYKMAPKRIRDLIMTARIPEKKGLEYGQRLFLDALRLALVSSIEKLLKKRLPQRTWNGKKYACLVTHDIESRQGLRVAHSLKKTEEKYDIPAAWYVPSDHFQLDISAMRELANCGEIGSHDTKHDGKLAQLSRDKIVRRLHESKLTLSKSAHCSVDGFRAPLLQHNMKIIDALRLAGYSYDTSIPTWEPKHPSTMNPHGIGTIYPIMLDRVVELPVTLPQDHQMIHVLGMNPRETIRTWIYFMSIIREMEGLCVLLIHPDYELACQENLVVYEELLNFIRADNNVWIALPRNLVDLVINRSLPT